MYKAKVKSRKEGTLLNIANGHYRIIISGKETEGRYAIIEMNVPPGAGPPPHAHINTEELFYVAEGSVDFYTEDGTQTAKMGDLIRVPKNGGVHAFKNISDKPAVLICTVYPSGFDEMFERVSQTPEHAKHIGEQFGNVFYPLDYFTV
ncbi:cupin domain [Anseongella ginsenosidimutans]|uniref:Cupin domain n=1 Tax=Anseongella ginsenosidimutans TaxID=496056 RepID=A0A4R3KK15_9SPHI|nr:cupin domain-containing protein [Anseongella ginsenosidimutans]QEC53604.1 cupin domain-containing protein [Anseongella ginsenosidimutans]TCS83947.1 cupin domain [Anseongella ginsenosidimutans]